MKKIFLAFLMLFSIAYTAKAQTPPLNKQQTLDYIEKLYKSSQPEEYTVGLALDDKVLVIKARGGTNIRRDLSKITSLKVGKRYSDNSYMLIDEKDKDNEILWGIQIEYDANRLKKALEHLIELLQTEKSTDPFDK